MAPLKGLYVTICSNLHVLITCFIGHMRAVGTCIEKWDLPRVSLLPGRACGWFVWCCWSVDFRSDFLWQSKGCDLIRLTSVSGSTWLTERATADSAYVTKLYSNCLFSFTQLPLEFCSPPHAQKSSIRRVNRQVEHTLSKSLNLRLFCL